MNLTTAIVSQEVKEILKSNDLLGFSYLGQAVSAILNHDDFGTRWIFESLEDQKTVELWRAEVIRKNHLKPAYITTL
jgi:hypothetical protein